MYILGINGGFRMGYQDVSAVLLKDGQIVTAVEEERITRIKFSPGKLPERAIESVLKMAGITIQDIDVVACHGATWGDQFPKDVEGYFKFRFGYCPSLKFYHHHDAHAASAYYASGFDEAMIMTVDGSGDGCSTQLGYGKDGKLEMTERMLRPNSLGMFYSMITQYCGFTKESDEYKLMGLASYGDPTKVDLDWLLDTSVDYTLNTDYMVEIAPGAPQPTRQQPLLSQGFIDKLGKARLRGEPFADHYKHVAAAAQAKLEEALINLVTRLHKETGMRKLCLAGGVALNCVANQKLAALDFVDEIYVQPASNDAGISLGCAYLAAVDTGITLQPMQSVYTGPEFTNKEIEAALKLCGASYERVDDPAQAAAGLIALDQVIGWFQGRAEFGPRALGARSILGNAQNPDMQDLINQKIKFREEFRPFCPSVLSEDAGRYFEGATAAAKHMTITCNVHENEQETIPAVTHVDGTARIQSVSKQDNPLFYSLLAHLKERTGQGICINTSFNRNGEPMVLTPNDALATFAASGLDALVIGNYIVEKAR